MVLSISHRIMKNVNIMAGRVPEAYIKREMVLRGGSAFISALK